MHSEAKMMLKQSFMCYPVPLDPKQSSNPPKLKYETL